MQNLRMTLAVLVGLLLLGAVCLSAQSGSVVQDWTTNRVLPAVSGKAAASAALKDPHLRMSLALREAAASRTGHRSPVPGTGVEWSVSLGPSKTSRGVAEGEFPAKFTASTSPSFPSACTTDFVVFTIAMPNKVAPAAGVQANIVGLNNLYTKADGTGSCPGTAPNFAFSYAADDGGIFLSPVLSLDGTKAAFVVSSTSRTQPKGNRAVFEVLSITQGQGTNATTGAVSPAAGALTSIDYTNVRVPGCTGIIKGDDFGSSPYVDYASDGAFVGANNGRLYHISHVFNGTPTLDWCVTVTTNSQVTSPVYDAQHGKVYVSNGDNIYSFRFDQATGFSDQRGIQVGAFHGYSNPSIVDSVQIDPFNGWVYTAASADVTNTYPVVSQMPLDLTSHIDLPIGGTSASGYILGANFDNAYLTNGPAGGTLYACGLSGMSNNVPALYSAGFNSDGTLNPSPLMAGNANINASGSPAGICSPIVTFYDGTTDRLYVSTGTGSTNVGSNLLTGWTINSPLNSTSATPSASAPGMLGGTSAFVLDYLKNTATNPGTNGVYFGTRSTGSTAQCGSGKYCAIKVTQDTLQ